MVELRKQQVADAVKSVAAKHEKEVSFDEHGFVLMPGDILVSCKDGALECSDPVFKSELMDCILDAAMNGGAAQDGPREVVNQKPAAPEKQKITSRSQAGNLPGTSLDRPQQRPAQNPGVNAVNTGKAIETMQRLAMTKPETYRVGKNLEAYAATKIKAFQEMGGSYNIVSSDITPDMARYHIRGTLPDGRYDESEYTVFRASWSRDMAWDMVDKQMEAGNNILNPDSPSLDNEMPCLRLGAMMKVRKKDENSNILIDVPAAYYIATTINKLWKFQYVQAQTKAKAKIAKELCGNVESMMEQGELDDEDREREQVAKAKK